MTSEPRNYIVEIPQQLATELQTEENAITFGTEDFIDIGPPIAEIYYKKNELSGYKVIIITITIIICLCGLVGNGIVIWLLGFRTKRNSFYVYILNLAIADFTHLLNEILGIALFFTTYFSVSFWYVIILSLFLYSVGLSLLMAISIERCVSVLWPIWYKCHRPAHLSTIVCALIWVLFLSFSVMISTFNYLQIEGVFIMWVIYGLISLPTFLVLFMSSLTLFIRVQCYSQQRKPNRLYWTILLNVLVFLLLGVPHGVYLAFTLFTESALNDPGLFTFISFLSPINSAANPIIYFFIGQHRQEGGRKPLQEVLKRALMDENEEAEQGTGRTSSLDRA